MLLQFSIKNFRTFKEKATLSLIASNYDKDTREDENIFFEKNFGIRLLKSAVVYGANASGKSKLFDALAFMRYFVIHSSKEGQKGDAIPVRPFLLSEETENEPSEFEIIFLFKGVLFRYGFEATKEKIISEWLYQKAKVKEVELFYRDENGINTHDRNFTKGETVVKEGLIRDNALLVSVAAQFNEKSAIAVIDWFKGLKTISELSENNFEGNATWNTKDLSQKEKILELLKAADFGIRDIKSRMLDVDDVAGGMPLVLREEMIRLENQEKGEVVSDVFTMHRKYDINKKAIDEVSFLLNEDESSGTRRFFALIGPILEAIENGYTLVVDELDSKLHPNLVCKLVSLFNSKEFNKKNAQLIFNAHDTNLLGSGLFRRDQIWFTSKDKFGEAKLYSLADFKSDEVKKTEPFEDNYVRGKYGAVPFLGFFDHLKISFSNHENEKQKV